MSAVLDRRPVRARPKARFTEQGLGGLGDDVVGQLPTAQDRFRSPSAQWSRPGRSDGHPDILDTGFVRSSKPDGHIENGDRHTLGAHDAAEGSLFIRPAFLQPETDQDLA
jgi:hypothetical protein